jgi:L,D-peptidoglycan transpeptidase YkuD (ErfK/YbiS/YcfS/YnhG family)
MTWYENALISRRAVFRDTALGASVILGGCSYFMASTQTDTIDVSAPSGAIEGTLRFGSLEYACMVGRSGIVAPKHEGDGGTPAGLFPLREVRYRPDRLAAPATRLPVRATRKSDGWCDDPNDPGYNRLIALPYNASAEKMWRDDDLYDALAVIGYNDAPPVPRLGSAIFIHVARDIGGGKLGPTVGCVSLRKDQLLAVLARCTPETMIRIHSI